MNIVTIRVPSARRICTPVNHALRKFNINANAYSSRPPISAHTIEHLPCPIEPTTPDRLWLVVASDTDINVFLEATFLNEAFVLAALPKAHKADDMFAMECLMIACSARKVATYFNGRSATKNVYKAAIAESNNLDRKHLAEHVLSIPSLKDALLEFVETLLADNQIIPKQS